jgi:hypothetical protein
MNKCGTCTTCCTICEIPELNKPAGQLCKHYSNGCTIYDTRPEACKNFHCLYVLQNIPEHYRPDNLGVMFEKRPGYGFWVGVETVKGALHSKNTLNVVKALERDNSVCALEGLDGNNFYNLLPGMQEGDFIEMINEAKKNTQEI